MRVGFGYDIHRLSENRKLILGGVNIPYSKGLLGHSDADVLIHAIVDSLLGAAALGDIGKFFPDNQLVYKDADSKIFLREICELLEKSGFEIINIDSTIVAQEPKLAPYIDEMRKNIAQALNIELNCVSIKSTTNEGLGPIGEGKGIAAHAISSIKSLKEKYSLEI